MSGYGQQPTDDRLESATLVQSMESTKDTIVRRITESAATVDSADVQAAAAKLTAAVEYRFDVAKADVDRIMAGRALSPAASRRRRLGGGPRRWLWLCGGPLLRRRGKDATRWISATAVHGGGAARRTTATTWQDEEDQDGDGAAGHGEEVHGSGGPRRWLCVGGGPRWWLWLGRRSPAAAARQGRSEKDHGGDATGRGEDDQGGGGPRGWRGKGAARRTTAATRQDAARRTRVVAVRQDVVTRTTAATRQDAVRRSTAAAVRQGAARWSTAVVARQGLARMSTAARLSQDVAQGP
ncbi:hypothetical protein OsI_25367 [Oryza sativa Indica Group]|uniref:Uncharacterized protein n=1 Tax=Oryza sativa subsp. indica TaxID=39946 RepID=A2YJF8_ORYSI|nr:hypothetical protein OsI_25367 [Oryza sativa Indica Group]